MTEREIQICTDALGQLEAARQELLGVPNTSVHAVCPTIGHIQDEVRKHIDVAKAENAEAATKS